MKRSKIRSGKEIVDILKPLYSVVSPQIRQHFLDPEVILVLSGAHPASKIIIHNPSQEIFHEIRTINLILRKNKVRFRISAKYLRKEVNNLQRLASIIIESIDGYERLSRYTFPKEKALIAKGGFIDVEKWVEERIKNNKKTYQTLLTSIEEGEVPYTKLNLIDSKEKDHLIGEFLDLQEDISADLNFHDAKYFNLLSRVNKNSIPDEHTFDEILENLKIVYKNSQQLALSLEQIGLTATTLETLNEMLVSKYSLLRKIAENTLRENSQKLQIKLNYAENFTIHNLERKIYLDSLKRLNTIEKLN